MTSARKSWATSVGGKKTTAPRPHRAPESKAPTIDWCTQKQNVPVLGQTFGTNSNRSSAARPPYIPRRASTKSECRSERAENNCDERCVTTTTASVSGSCAYTAQTPQITGTNRSNYLHGEPARSAADLANASVIAAYSLELRNRQAGRRLSSISDSSFSDWLGIGFVDTA